MEREEHNRIICALEVALHDEGCNEYPLWLVIQRIQALRGCAQIAPHQISEVLEALVQDELFEAVGVDANNRIIGTTLICRSQSHPSVATTSGGNPILL